MTKFEAGELASDGLTRADRRAYEAKVAGPEREVGQLTMALDLLKKGLTSAHRARSASSASPPDFDRSPRPSLGDQSRPANSASLPYRLDAAGADLHT